MPESLYKAAWGGVLAMTSLDWTIASSVPITTDAAPLKRRKPFTIEKS
jgi:hypothetical protein